ncbi:MAG: zinc-ribbon and DUF3426 domain-containing protein [Desulfovibrionaceae bacterium]|nr:zinc-ribbon and DUF3426 domain-containing protein [Desulfovibrionaceae bacterium]
MEIQCPQCSSRFTLPDSVKEGAKLRCSVCSTVFLLKKEENPQSEPAPQPQPRQQESLQLTPPVTKDAKPAKPAPEKKNKKLLFIAGSVLLFLLCLAGSLIWYFAGRSASGGEVVSEAEMANRVRLLTMRNVRQYIVDNEKIGKVFVIEGRVVNEFPEPKELITVEGAIYGKDKRVIATKKQRCGTQLSLFQLQVLSENEMDSFLNNKMEILTNNINLKQGAEVPFMVLFYAPPDDVAEFGVRIVDVKDVPVQVR